MPILGIKTAWRNYSTSQWFHKISVQAVDKKSVPSIKVSANGLNFDFVQVDVPQKMDQQQAY